MNDFNQCDNYDSVYQKALNKIDSDSRFKPACCCIQGPTGPTGPSGGPTGPTGPTGATAKVVKWQCLFHQKSTIGKYFFYFII